MFGKGTRAFWRDIYLAIIAIVSGFFFLATWYVAPDLLATPLWSGKSLTVAFLLGTLSIVVPVVVSWLIVAGDRRTDDQTSFETSVH